MADKQVIVELSASIAGFTQSMEKVRGTLSSIERNTKQTADTLSGTFKKVGMMIKGALAFDMAKDFAVGVVQSTAEIKAMGAMFDQVFGEVPKQADALVNDLSSKLGMLPNRIKPALADMGAKFLGLGIGAKEATELAGRGMTVMADASAFNDIALTDAQSALNSFINGNYEGGEAIKLFANETQLASFASETLGKEWKTLDEAGKQVARLEYAEAMMDSMKATGMASTEAGEYTNVMGNLKQAWTDFQAVLGTPFLAGVVSGMQGLMGILQNVNVEGLQSKLEAFVGYMSTTVGPALSGTGTMLKNLFKAFSDAGGASVASAVFETLKGVLTWFFDNLDTITIAVIALGAGFATFKTLTSIATGVKAVQTGLALFRSGALASSLAVKVLNSSLLASPFLPIALAVMALVAVGLLLWNNWSIIGPKLAEIWEAIKTKAGEVWEAIGTKITEIETAINEAIQARWESVKVWFSEFFSNVGQMFTTGWQSFLDIIVAVGTAIWNFIQEWGLVLLAFILNPMVGIYALIFKYWDQIKAVFVNVGTAIWGKVKEVFNGIKSAIQSKMQEVKTTVTTKVNEAKTAMSNGFQQAKQAVEDKFNQIKSAVRNKMQDAVSAVKEKVTSMKSAFTEINWASVGSQIVNGVVNGLKNAGGALIRAAKDMAKSAFDSATSFLEVNSPSRLFRDEVGRWIPEGVAVGIERNTDVVDDAVVSSLASPLSVGNSMVNGIGSTTRASNGSGGAVNNFNISQLVVREEADVQKIAKELAREQDKFKRAGGRVIYGTA